MIDLSVKPKVEWRPCAIPKKDGSSRYLLVPGDELKAVQRNILEELYKVKEFRPHKCATGFVPYRNTLTGAMMHDRNAVCFIQLDIHNFFPTFPVNVVRESLLKVYDSLTADYILQYCVFHGKRREQLPQGAPTSPFLTNIGMKETDNKIFSIARGLGFVFSRYADDMAFSTTDETDLEKRKKQLFAAVSGLLKSDLGLTISWKKTLVSYKNSPRVPRRIVGVTIRKDGLGYNAPRKFRENTRAAVHGLYKKLKAGVSKEELWPLYWQVQGKVNYSNYLRSRSDLLVSGFDTKINKEEYDYIRKVFNYADRSYRKVQ